VWSWACSACRSIRAGTREHRHDGVRPGHGTGDARFGFITDEVGALGSSRPRALNGRLEELSKSQNIQLFVVFVDTFSNPDNSQEWTNQVAVDNGLGQQQYLLAIATQSRQYYLSADKAGPIPLSRVDQISRSLVNDLRTEDWAAPSAPRSTASRDPDPRSRSRRDPADRPLRPRDRRRDHRARGDASPLPPG
jgi:hypothetical protein